MPQAPTGTATITRKRILMVEDHVVVRRGLSLLINDEPDLEICGDAGSAKEALDQIQKLHPDLVIVDITLGDESGLDLIKTIHRNDAHLPILALSMHEELLYAERAMRAGALGYVMKKEASDKFITAIRQVLAGEVWVSDRMSSKIVRRLVDGGRGAGDGAEQTPLQTLTDREFEVFNYIAQGIGPTEIGKRLGVSVKTIETHREHIKAKLGCNSGAELTRFAVEWSSKHG